MSGLRSLPGTKAGLRSPTATHDFARRTRAGDHSTPCALSRRLERGRRRFGRVRDSVALTLLMAELSAAGVFRLAGLAHLNHGLRGAASDCDAEFCARLAQDRGVCSTSKSVTSPPSPRAPAVAGRGGARGALRLSRTGPSMTCSRCRRRGTHARRSGRDGAAAVRARRWVARADAIHPRRQRIIRPLIDLRRAD